MADGASEIIQKINDENMDFISAFIKNGWKNMLARLLVYVGTEKASETLDALPPELATELSQRKAALGDAKPSDGAVMVDGAFVLKDFDGATIDTAIEKLKKASVKDFSVREQCEKLFDANPFLSLKMQDSLFTFDDIATLDDRAVQMVLHEVDTRNLTLALMGASNEIKEKIFRNLPPRAANTIRGGMEFMAPVRKDDVESARAHVMNIVLSLQERGEIVIARRGLSDD